MVLNPPAPKLSLSKVPAITASFWVIKILTTGMGEALADFFDHAFDPILVVAISGVVLAIAIWLQFRANRFVAWRYWFAVSMVSVFGTLAADAVHVLFGVPYLVSTLAFIVALVVIFAIWRFTEKSVSITTINTVRREFYYWAVVMATFALGTAAGDMTAMSFNWGFLLSGIIFTVAFLIPLFFYGWATARKREGTQVWSFWLAYIITRPLGASYADWLALPTERGGMNFGTLAVSLGLIALIAVFVSFNRNRVKN